MSDLEFLLLTLDSAIQLGLYRRKLQIKRICDLVKLHIADKMHIEYLSDRFVIGHDIIEYLLCKIPAPLDN